MCVRNGTLYIADNACHMVRSIDLAGVTQAPATSWGRIKTLYR
jgi:hypothetical protein